MDDSRRPTRGLLVRRYEVHCLCGAIEDLSVDSLVRAAREAWRRGWRPAPRDGWLCPACNRCTCGKERSSR